MATLAAGSTVSVYCPLTGTMTVTPGTSGRVSINARGRDGSQSLAPRELYTAETLSVTAGDVVSLEAINVAATYTDPAEAGPALQALVSGAWKYTQGRVLADAQSPPQHWGGQIISTDYAISSGAPTLSVVTRNGQQCLKVVTGVGVTANVDLTLIGDVGWWGRLHALVEGDRSANANQIVFLVTPDNFSNYAQNIFTTQTTPLNNSFEQGGRYTIRCDGQVTAGATAQQFTGVGASWSVSTPTLDGSTATVNKVRFRVIPVGGQSATVYLYGLSLGPRRRKGRVFVVADDGYKSLIQLAFPILQARGIPLTFSTISNLMDNRVNVLNYMTWQDCRQIVASGGQVVAHGPLATGGASNLIAGLATNELRVADMSACREAIRANGCDTPNYDKVYVWPQGNFQSATSDLTLLDAAIAAGFTVGRSANPITNYNFDFSAFSKYQRMALPIIGHSYAGGGEAANITALTTAIGAAGTARSDIILMLHQCVKNADTPDAIGITVANLITLADAIVTEVNAGRLQAGVLGDLAEPSIWAA